MDLLIKGSETKIKELKKELEFRAKVTGLKLELIKPKKQASKPRITANKNKSAVKKE